MTGNGSFCGLFSRRGMLIRKGVTFSGDMLRVLPARNLNSAVRLLVGKTAAPA